MPQDPRQQIYGQVLGAVIGKVIKDKMDQAAFQKALQGDQTQNPSDSSPQQGTQGQLPQQTTDSSYDLMKGPMQDVNAPQTQEAVQKVAGAQAQSAQPGSVSDGQVQQMLRPPTPPNAGVLALAKKGNKYALSAIQNYQLQRNNYTDFMTARREQRGEESLAETARYHKFQEGKAAAQLGMQQEGLKLREEASTRAEKDQARKDVLFPLTVENQRLAINQKKLKIDELIKQQGTVWSPEETHKAAEVYIQTGMQHPPNFGMGNTGASGINRTNFWREVFNGFSLTPDQYRQVAMGYRTQQAATQTGGRVLANLSINLAKADQLEKPLNQAFAKLEPLLSNATMWNRFKRAVLTGTGDPAFSQADIYVNSFLTAWQKSLNPNGVLTEGYRNEIGKLLDTVSSPKQLKAKLDAIRTDMELERKAVIGGTSQLLEGKNFSIQDRNLGGENAGPTGQPESDTGDNDPFGLLK